MANEENLIPFKPGQSGNPNGRPKKSFRIINDSLKEKGHEPLSKTDLIDAYGLIFNCTEAELKELAGDPDTPFALRLIILDLNSKVTRAAAIRDYRDYMFGRAQSKQVHEFTEGIKVTIDFSSE